MRSHMTWLYQQDGWQTLIMQEMHVLSCRVQNSLAQSFGEERKADTQPQGFRQLARDPWFPHAT